MTTQPAVLRAVPLINAKREHGGMRIVIDNVSATDDDVRNTLTMIEETEAAARHPLIVAFDCDRLPTSLHNWEPPANTYPEFQGSWLASPVTLEMLSSGIYPLWCLNGALGEPLDAALSKSLVYTVASATAANSFDATPLSPAGKSRVLTGAVSHAAADAAFAKGGTWIAGWPVTASPVVPAIKSRQSTGRESALRLLALVQADADVSELDAVLRHDAALSFKLLRYINSAANGLSVQVQSLSHAVAIIGYRRLARWLAVLAMASNDDVNLTPVMGISLRRAHFMERMGKLAFDEADSDELFITGLFSLLNVIFAEPIEELVEKMHLPDAVSDSLLGSGEPYGPLLRLAEAIEGDDALAIRDMIELLGLSAADVNRALLMAIRDTDLVAMG